MLVRETFRRLHNPVNGYDRGTRRRERQLKKILLNLTIRRAKICRSQVCLSPVERLVPRQWGIGDF